MPETIRVEIISDVVCPWCVIGYRQLATASEQTGIEIDVDWHPFELNPEMAEGGEDLRDHLARKYGTSTEQSQTFRDRLTALGAGLGFTFRYADDMRIVNTFRAHQVIDWARDQLRGHEMKQALFEAYFTRGENLNDIGALVAVVQTLGLEANAAREMLEAGHKARAVRDKQQIWAARGITGVPAMIFQGQHLITGAQGEANYAQILQQLAAQNAA